MSSEVRKKFLNLIFILYKRLTLQTKGFEQNLRADSIQLVGQELHRSRQPECKLKNP